MMREQKPGDLKKPTMAAVLVTAAALLTAVAAQSLRQETALPAQGEAVQTHFVYYTPNPAASQEIEASQTPAASTPYRVGVYRGKIGVFEGDEDTPFLTADVDVYLLPEEDVALLRRGLFAHSLTEVRALLEDYA